MASDRLEPADITFQALSRSLILEEASHSQRNMNTTPSCWSIQQPTYLGNEDDMLPALPRTATVNVCHSSPRCSTQQCSCRKLQPLPRLVGLPRAHSTAQSAMYTVTFMLPYPVEELQEGSQ
eukprot:3121463-Amphidinium_carterae.1